MTQFTYATSNRVRKARLAGVVGDGGLLALRSTLALSAAGAVFFMAAGSTGLAFILVGLACYLAMALLWLEWDVRNIKAKIDYNSGPSVALDAVLSADIVARVPWPGTPVQVFAAIRNRWQSRFILLRFGLHEDDLAAALASVAAMDIVWNTAFELAKQMQLEEIDAAVITVALALNAPALQPAFAQAKIEPHDLIEGLFWIERILWLGKKSDDPSYFGGIARDWSSGYTPVINRYGRNLSAEIERGNRSFHVLSHAKEIEQIMTNLRRQVRNSVALIGEDGAGKSSAVYALAEEMLRGENVGGLAYQQVVTLNASLILSSAQRPGELEQTVMTILSEAVHARNIILFLDEAQLFFGSGTGTIDLSKILLPVLQQGFRMIIAMNPTDWQRISTVNPGLATLFNVVQVPPPSELEVMRILEDRAILMEHRSNTLFTYQAIREIYRLSERYVRDLAFPGRGIKLLEDSVDYAVNGLVLPVSVQTAIERTVGVKVAPAGAEEKSKLLDLENVLHSRMINQTRAVSVVSSALRRARAGVSNPNRPVGSFLFLGPTGVGKTELAKALAGAYYGGRDQMIRVDMSEYQQASDVSRVLASASEQNASTLLMGVREKPFSVVLLDEIEKAHPDILNLLLQLLDEGQLTDTGGRKISFKDSIVIATSNAGADEIRSHIEAGESLETFEDTFVDKLINSRQFKPELLNRFDEIVLFRPLTKDELRQVVALMVQEVNQTLENQKIQVALTDDAVDMLVDKGYDPRLGARPMRRMVQRLVENTVANQILSGSVQAGQTITLSKIELEAATSGR